MFKDTIVKNTPSKSTADITNRSLKLPTLSVFLKQHILSKKRLLMVLTLIIVFYSYYVISQEDRVQHQSKTIISSPKINDIYFFDFRKLRNNLRPNEKYRLAKVVDITGDVITLVYGSLYYARQNAAINSIYYGQLTYKDYFEAKRFDFQQSELKQQFNSGAIYRAMRPIHDKLLGHRVGPVPRTFSESIFIQGRKENLSGEALLKDRYGETNLKHAFELFTKSASYNYAKAQVNLAQMYINGQYVEKDLNLALYWLNLAALQSHKPAILKYEIICKQVYSCDIVEFFQNLIASGVDVKVRQLDTKLSVAPLN